KLEVFLGPDLGKERRKMKVPVVQRYVGSAHPFTEGCVGMRLVSAAHRERVESEFEICGNRVVLVVWDAGARVIESPPQVRAIAGVVGSLTRITCGVAEQRHDRGRDG